jgi:hypothetical protein
MLKHFVIIKIRASRTILLRLKYDAQDFKLMLADRLLKYYDGDDSKYLIVGLGREEAEDGGDLLIYKVQCEDTNWMVEMKLAPDAMEEYLLTNSKITYGELK